MTWNLVNWNIWLIEFRYLSLSPKGLWSGDIKGLYSQTFPVQTFVHRVKWRAYRYFIDILLSSNEIDKPMLVMYEKLCQIQLEGMIKISIYCPDFQRRIKLVTPMSQWAWCCDRKYYKLIKWYIYKNLKKWQHEILWLSYARWIHYF